MSANPQQTSATNFSAKNPESIRKMFGSIAGAYDPTNTVLSLGIHKLWKKTLVKKSSARVGDRILDCATGTGDLAFEFERTLGKNCEIVATDFCPEMLEVAQKKAKSASSQIQFSVADATHLPFSDRSFDVATISFGIRNTPSPEKTLSEMARVLRPGGRVMVLEFGKPRSSFVKAAFSWYSKKVLPVLGGWMSGQPEAYRYLEASSAEFPAAEDFLELARRSAPFSECSYQTFHGGIAYLYTLKVGGEKC